MTEPVEYLRQGDPEGALASLQSLVRAEPADAKHRIFLFQLLCVLGQWERALTQLNVAGELDPGALGMVQVYREALRIEALRADVFAGKRSPLVFGEPEQWVAMLLEALRLGAEGEYAQSQALREQAFERAPAVPGQVDGRPFEWIADADPRLGPTIEAIVNARYYWIPLHRIAQMRIEKPVDLRDLVWMPVEFEWTNGGHAVGLIPTRYPGSEVASDPLLKLARKTEWTELGAGLSVGLGQRLLATDGEDYPLMEIQHVVLGAAAAGDVAPEGDDAAGSDS